MDTLTAAAASGMRTRMESLDMLANNLANAATSGYKADREFYGTYLAPELAAQSAADPATLPVVEKPWVDFSQGLLHDTGSPFDLALSGDGLFAVNSPSGPLYTRNGNFTTSTGGELVTAEGYAVRGAKGKSLQVQPGEPIEVLRDGSVRQGGKQVGQLQIVEFKGASGLAKMGNSYFRHPDPKAVPGAAAGFQVHQGKLESSNVGPAESAVRLVSVMRQFEMLQKAVQIGADMDRKAVEEVARIGS